MEELRGWLSGSKGRRYLATDEGWFELFHPDGRSWSINGDSDRRPARLSGERMDRARFAVHRVLNVGTAGSRRPPFVVTPPPTLRLAARARAAVERELQSRGIPQVMLPSLWTSAREYGEQEMSLAHADLAEELVLLQSPEFPMYAALAMGVGAFYCWGRSYRIETVESVRHLMEFEQLDIGFTHAALPEMLELVESLVRVAANELGADVADEPFVVCSNKNAPDHGAGMSLVRLHPSVPPAAVDLIVRRLWQIGANARIVEQSPPIVAVDAHEDAVAAEAAKVIDSVNRIMASELPRPPLRPWWRSPLSLVWEDELDSTRSEHKIRAITSARMRGEMGEEHAEEAELYVDDVEIAHAGLLADRETFLRNLRDAAAPPDRYEWLIPLLESAPPGMVKVGVGWERLVAALLRDVAPTDVQLFPRLGSGRLLRPLPF